MRRALLAALLAACLAIPAALALAQRDAPEGDARLHVLVRNEGDAGFVRLRVLDASGGETHDEVERLPADGGWGIELRVPEGTYQVTLSRSSGAWPFSTRLVAGASVDPSACAATTATLRFVTTFDAGGDAIVGPAADCGIVPAGPSAGASVRPR